MFAPRQRILFTCVAALAVAVAVSLAVAGSQEASGRSELTARARAFLRSIQGTSGPDGRGAPPDATEFLRPADRASPAKLLGLRRLTDSFGDTNEALLVAQVKLLGEGRAVTYSPVSLGVPTGRRRMAEGLRELAWVRGPDGRWYLDPAGL